MTSPSGDSSRPAVERRIAGSPPIASTPLWSACSWVTSSRSASTPVDRWIVELHPAALAAPTCPRTDRSQPSSPPCRSGETPTGRTTQRACCSSLVVDCVAARALSAVLDPACCGAVAGPAPVAMIACARSDSCPRASATRAAAIRQAMIANANASCSPARNGAEIRCGKNDWPMSAARLCAEQRRQRVRAEQVLDRVVAEERREQDRDGRQVRDAVRRWRAATPCACRPAVSVVRAACWTGRGSSA